MTDFQEIFTDEFRNKLKRLHELLHEAYHDWLERDPDPSGKGSEGQVCITTSDHFFSYNSDVRPRVTVYSYILGPYRNHEFRNIDDALVEVGKWHKRQLEYDYSKDED